MTQEQRFWSKVAKSAGCWEWTACTLRAGYGLFNFQGKTQTAHRVSWQIANGPIADGACVLHRCDNRRCVRPDHLFLGTIADNNRDMAQKNRCARTMAKLSAEQVLEIKIRLGGRRTGYRRIAEDYGVHRTQIGRIARGEHWDRV